VRRLWRLFLICQMESPKNDLARICNNSWGFHYLFFETSLFSLGGCKDGQVWPFAMRKCW
jgi:hypothetical protein